MLNILQLSYWAYLTLEQSSVPTSHNKPLIASEMRFPPEWPFCNASRGEAQRVFRYSGDDVFWRGGGVDNVQVNLVKFSP